MTDTKQANAPCGVLETKETNTSSLIQSAAVPLWESQLAGQVRAKEKTGVLGNVANPHRAVCNVGSGPIAHSIGWRIGE